MGQYLLSLGEFDTDYSSGFFYNFMWMNFLVVSFLLIVTFLNMVIAIMGDTYGKVAENWDLYALVEQTKIYADFMPMIKINE